LPVNKKRGFFGKNLDNRYRKCKLGKINESRAGNPVEQSGDFLGKEVERTGMFGAG
jgi:hypothetical protein